MKKLLLVFFYLLIQPTIIYAKPIPESFADIVEPLLSSVVSVASTTIVEERQQSIPQFPEGSPFEEFFKEYFDQQRRNTPSTRPLIGLGSGFIIDESGIIVTNNHVIEGADEITVIMEDGEEFEASILGKDPKADIAIIKFDPVDKELNTLKWGDSDSTKVGDWAIAIGNPMGFGGTVTVGIVSAIARDIGSGPYVKFIQTDASINRGNSGGPLFNIEGEVIGINSAIISQTGGSIGLGFAIPSNSAKKIVSQLKEFGRTKRGWLGVQIQMVTEEISESLGLENNNGAFIGSVQLNSPAEIAGIEAGDVIIRFNNFEINNYRDLPKIVAETDIGSKVIVQVWRKNKTLDISVELGELDEDYLSTGIKDKTNSTEIKDIGIAVRDLTPGDFLKYELSKDVTGVIVTELIDQNSSLEIDDIIIEVNREYVLNFDQFEKSILDIKKTGRSSILLRVIRNKKTVWVTLKYL